MIVCHCAVVRCGDVREAADRGASTVAQVCGATGAGRDCGACVFALKRVLCEHQDSMSVPLPEVEGAAS
ncbi:(2Fe-2S)-binding protein [Nocardioides terrisoli]|uniref:(2Fe-2S)-binding protein n=1 Tax=Nocardioides terrisoli TaxID=3388267 RepID=UPI00287BBB31|nr:(2Fe-2S)-binding protein [Nocardioides marmorisolisilvae]